MTTLNEQLSTLVENFTACDVSVLSFFFGLNWSLSIRDIWHAFRCRLTPRQVSDALLKLQKAPEGTVPRAGYVADLSMCYHQESIKPRVKQSTATISHGPGSN